MDCADCGDGAEKCNCLFTPLKCGAAPLHGIPAAVLVGGAVAQLELLDAARRQRAHIGERGPAARPVPSIKCDTQIRRTHLLADAQGPRDIGYAGAGQEFQRPVCAQRCGTGADYC